LAPCVLAYTAGPRASIDSRHFATLRCLAPCVLAYTAGPRASIDS